MRYITLSEIKTQCRVDTNIDDALLSSIGDAVEQAAENYLHRPISDTLGVDGEIPPALKQGILMLCVSAYEDPSATTSLNIHISPVFEILVQPFCKY